MFEKVSYVSEARIYPVKSCKPVIFKLPDLVEVGETGLKGDREFMVTLPDGSFRTQRKRHKGFERLCLVQPELTDDHLKLSAEGMDSVSIPLDAVGRKGVDVDIWGDAVSATTYDEGSRWMSEFIEQECLLVRQASQRLINRMFAPAESRTSFADRNQIHAISFPTVQSLNVILREKHGIEAEIDRFRANLLLVGCDDREENNFKKIRIGNVELERTIPCERCDVPAINQETSKFDKAILEVLRNHRKPHTNRPPILGEQFRVTQPGSFRVGNGAEVKILEREEDGWSRTYDDSERAA